VTAEQELASLMRRWPEEFQGGARCALLGRSEAGERPRGFLAWPLERRNAWYAGFNQGFSKRGASVR
jgi:hypothetical protein